MDGLLRLDLKTLTTDLCQEAMAAANLPLRPPAPPQRLVIDLETNTLTLDGVPFTGLDPTGLRIVSWLWEAKGIVSSKDLCENVPGCGSGEKTVRRHLGKLPREIQALVKPRPGAGRYLELPPLSE
jgi:hypothetical protein